LVKTGEVPVIRGSVKKRGGLTQERRGTQPKHSGSELKRKDTTKKKRDDFARGDRRRKKVSGGSTNKSGEPGEKPAPRKRRETIWITSRGAQKTTCQEKEALTKSQRKTSKKPHKGKTY